MLLNVVLLNQVPIWEQLQKEEALLRADNHNWCIINRGSAPSIVMGISGTREEHVDEVLFAQNPVSLVRRFSGGGTVVVNEDTFFVSFIFEKQDINLENCPQKVMQWTQALYAKAYTHLPILARENDYVIGQKKIGGNAQYFTKTRWLHHTTFLWDYKPEEMQLLKMPKKRPAYRENRPHTDFITTLKSYFPSMLTLQEELLVELGTRFELNFDCEHLVQEALARPHRKALETWQ